MCDSFLGKSLTVFNRASTNEELSPSFLLRMKGPSKFVLLVACLIFIIAVAYGSEEKTRQSDNNEEEENDDIPRVRIKVFRGPMEEENGERFAPWGFWIKQPSG